MSMAAPLSMAVAVIVDELARGTGTLARAPVGWVSLKADRVTVSDRLLKNNDRPILYHIYINSN